MPDIAVTTVNLLGSRSDRNVPFSGVSNRFVPGSDIPLTPRRNDSQVRRECLVCELKSHLVVTFSGTAVGYGISTFFQRDFDLALCQKRPCDGSSEQILSFVHRAGFDQGPEIVGYELVAKIFDTALGGARSDRLFFQTMEFIVLTDVSRHSDDFATVVL